MEASTGNAAGTPLANSNVVNVNAATASNGTSSTTAVKTTTGTTSNTVPPRASALTDEEEAAKKRVAATLADEEAAKRRAAGTVADDEAAKKRAAPAAAEDEERKRREAAVNDGTDKIGTAASTNYKNPNGYSVDMPEYANRDRAAADNTDAPRKDEEKIEATSTATDGIATGVQRENIGNIEKVAGKESTLKYDTSYRIQFYALKKPIPLDTNYYTHLKGYEVVEENGYYKYMLGRYKSYEDCLRFWKSQIQPRYKESFIVKYIDGRRSFE